MEKLDQIARDISVIKTDIALIKNDVAHHIRRTDLAEENISLLRQEIKPIKEHVVRVDGVLRFFGVVSLVVGIVGGLVKLFWT